MEMTISPSNIDGTSPGRLYDVYYNGTLQTPPQRHRQDSNASSHTNPTRNRPTHHNFWAPFTALKIVTFETFCRRRPFRKSTTSLKRSSRAWSRLAFWPVRKAAANRKPSVCFRTVHQMAPATRLRTIRRWPVGYWHQVDLSIRFTGKR
jgi:hypothetical protein